MTSGLKVQAIYRTALGTITQPVTGLPGRFWCGGDRIVSGHSLEVALHELRKNAGSQFDPRVVSALEAVVERGDASRPM